MSNSYMSRFKRKLKWKDILSIVLVGVLFVGSVAGIGVLVSNKDRVDIKPSAFVLGAIDENGDYFECETSLVTDETFKCQGLSIEPDFRSSTSFAVYYYDADGVFLEATEVMTKTYSIPDDSEAVYARIVVSPASDSDVLEDDLISLFEKRSVLNDLKITVNRTQKETKTKVVNYREAVIGFWIMKDNVALPDQDIILSNSKVSASTSNGSEADGINLYISKTNQSIYYDDIDLMTNEVYIENDGWFRGDPNILIQEVGESVSDETCEALYLWLTANGSKTEGGN